MKRIILVFFLTTFGAGCATQNSIYYWGNYENLLYTSYALPGEASPNLQIAKITSDIQRADAEGKPVPPGIHAHLGMLYVAVDNMEQAHVAFIQEKTLYPESTIFMDGIIERGFKGGEQ
jgi:hypothetical protein